VIRFPKRYIFAIKRTVYVPSSLLRGQDLNLNLTRQRLMTSVLVCRLASFVLFLSLSCFCWGASGPALIVQDGTAGTEADVLSNLSGKLTGAGYTLTTNVGIPGGSLATYKQIWDIRFSNAGALTGGDITAYVAYLAGGGSLFVMGENVTNFATRDASIATLIQTAGGGTINLVTPNNAETVQAPFTGPTSVSAITFLAAAGTTANGVLSFIAKDVNNIGAGILFGPGALSSAMAGSLLVVFDVNFLLTGADATSQALSNNLVAYLAAPSPVPAAPGPVATPTLSEWAMILLACGLMLVAYRRLLPRQQTSPDASAGKLGL
jgi:hypothetical protein